MSTSKWVLSAVGAIDTNGRPIGKGINTLNNVEHVSANFNYKSITDLYTADYALYEIPSQLESQSYAITVAAACSPEDTAVDFTEAEYQELLNMLPEGIASDLNAPVSNVTVTVNADGTLTITITTGNSGINMASSTNDDNDREQEKEDRKDEEDRRDEVERKAEEDAAREEAAQELADNFKVVINTTVVIEAEAVPANPGLPLNLGSSIVHLVNADIRGIEVSISSNFVSGVDILGFIDQNNGISASYNSVTGILSLTGAASVADYIATLNSITYINSNFNYEQLPGVSVLVDNRNATNNVATDYNIILATASDTFIISGSENDIIIAAPNTTFINSGPGNDIVVLSSGTSLVFAGAGDDTIVGGTGNNVVYGEEGNDFISGGSGEDLLFGGPDNDLILGGPDNDVIYGGTGDDNLFAGAGEDFVVGGPGFDTIEAGSGEGVDIYVGDGGDLIIYTSTTEGVVVDFIKGDVYDSKTATTDLIDYDTFTGIGSITTGSGDDTIIGGTHLQSGDYDMGAGHDTLEVSALLDLDGTSTFKNIETIHLRQGGTLKFTDPADLIALTDSNNRLFITGESNEGGTLDVTGLNTSLITGMNDSYVLGSETYSQVLFNVNGVQLEVLIDQKVQNNTIGPGAGDGPRDGGSTQAQDTNDEFSINSDNASNFGGADGSGGDDVLIIGTSLDTSNFTASQEFFDIDKIEIESSVNFHIHDIAFLERMTNVTGELRITSVGEGARVSSDSFALQEGPGIDGPRFIENGVAFFEFDINNPANAKSYIRLYVDESLLEPGFNIQQEPDISNEDFFRLAGYYQPETYELVGLENIDDTLSLPPNPNNLFLPESNLSNYTVINGRSGVDTFEVPANDNFYIDSQTGSKFQSIEAFDFGLGGNMSLGGAQGVLNFFQNNAINSTEISFVGADITQTFNFGIGLKPTIVTLTIYALLPITRNTYIGLHQLPSNILEAAKGLGFTRLQRLYLIELPLARPVIFAGIRTATAMTIGITTIAAFIGAGGLGDFITQGLSLDSPRLILLGAIPTALLALAVDYILAQLETSLSARKRRDIQLKKLKFTLATLLVLLFLFFIAFSYWKQAQFSRKNTIIVASKNFTEQYILADMVADVLKAKTKLHIIKKLNIGNTTIVQNALLKGAVDLYPEYTGTGYMVVLHGKKKLSAQKTFATVKSEYQKRFNLTWLPPLGFSNSETIGVRESFAKQHHLKTLSDLTKIAPKITIAAPAEFISRSDGLPGLQKTYQLHFKKVMQMQPDLMYQAIKNKDVEAIEVFTTDGRIAAYHLRALADNKHFYPPYDAAIVIRISVLKAHPKIRQALKPLEGTINNKAMQQLNYQVNVLKRSPAAVAKAFLTKRHLLD